MQISTGCFFLALFLLLFLNACQPNHQTTFIYSADGQLLGSILNDSVTYATDDLGAIAPAFVDFVVSDLRQKEVEGIGQKGGSIQTSLHTILQRHARQAVSMHLKELQKDYTKHWKDNDPWQRDKRKGVLYQAMLNSKRYQTLKATGLPKDSVKKVFRTPIPMQVFTLDGKKDTVLSPMDSIRYHKSLLHASLIAMHPTTGQIQAWVGDIDYTFFGIDHTGITAPKWSNSTLDPFIYAVAFEEELHTPCDLFKMNDFYMYYRPDDPQQYTLKEGLALSMAYISEQLTEALSPDIVIDFLKTVELTDIQVTPYYLGQSQLNIRTSLCQLVAAYSSFTNHGVYQKPISITHILAKDSTTIWSANIDTNRLISAKTASLMTKLFQEQPKMGTARRLSFKYKLDNEIGTQTAMVHYNSKANAESSFFFGLLPKLTVGVWVGGDNRYTRFRSLRLSNASNTALPIFANLTKAVYADERLAIKPEDHFFTADSVSIDCPAYRSLK